ncbi:MAG TPA: NAD(P)-binding domain-containing protein [Gemmatimonadales bacterium]|nr:NAD(P)-binding domain-containing protein [Gemmatimonadales bacterium]
MTFCVIGAGAAGLAAARHLAATETRFEVIERERDVGGIWDASLPHSPVYRSAHLISSKPLTQFPDFPMPREYPDYPDHAQALEYLRGYAKAFGLYDHIRFGQTVERVERDAPGKWRVTLGDGTRRTYAGVIVASGVHSVPTLPAVPGRFEGVTIHSRGYKSPEIFRGRRVLVVGAGNSGCDIAAEAGRHAAQAFLSVRRGYHFIPKYSLGRPTDQVGEVGHRLRLPLAVRRGINDLVLRVVIGRPEDYGLPKPDHRLLESHPIVNSEILPAIRRGQVRPRPDLVELRGREAVFKDGTAEPIDLIVFATGYRVSFPFLDTRHLNSADGRPDFYLHTFHPTYDDLFVLGNLQPDSGVWPLMDLQARAIAGYIGRVEAQGRGVVKVRELKRGPAPDLSGGLRYVPSERHRYEVEHAGFARRMRSVIQLLTS